MDGRCAATAWRRAIPQQPGVIMSRFERAHAILALPLASLLFGSLAAGALRAQPSAAEREALRAATDEDHRDMLRQLGIEALRPGPSGDESAPNHANYDEAKANPYPDLPDPLTLTDGTKVTTAAMWWRRRRPEIVEDFEREVVGRIPRNVPAVHWVVAETREWQIGGHRVVGRQLVGRVDNSADPKIAVDICAALVTPADARGPVPVMIMFGAGALPDKTPAAPADNEAVPSTAGSTAGSAPVCRTPAFYRRLAAAAPASVDPPATQQLIDAGWGYVSLSPTSIQADNGAGLTSGSIGLANQGKRRKPDDWGALRAWAWGASRTLDYLETQPGIDARRVGVEGVSRYGKAALVTMAFDRRFAVVLVGSSGEGGAKLHRRQWGEQVENLTGAGEYHWMAGNFLKYGAAKAAVGSMDAGDLPVDAHELIALCAPRPTFISYGVPEKGDAKWLDQQGSFMAAVAAGPVFRLLGAKDLGTSDDYRHAKMPPVNVGLLGGDLAWRQHDGGHTDAPNWKYFIPWAEQRLARVR
jgi:(4-O-methyl)-D-glucuronate---lignin esterase